MRVTRKLRLANAILSIVLFLLLYARAFYLLGSANTDAVDWILCIYYFFVMIAACMFYYKDENYGKSFYILMAVFALLLPAILWIVFAVAGGGVNELKRYWHFVAATVFSVVIAIISIVGSIEQKYE